MEDVQDFRDIEMPEDQEEHSEEKGGEPHGERQFVSKQTLQLFMWQLNCCREKYFICPVFNFSGEDASHGQEERPSTPSHLATTVF